MEKEEGKVKEEGRGEGLSSTGDALRAMRKEKNKPGGKARKKRNRMMRRDFLLRDFRCTPVSTGKE